MPDAPMSDSRPEELELTIPGLKLAARAWGPLPSRGPMGQGPIDGRPVLGLHGWLDNAATFDALAPQLDGLRLVCLDLAGHGRSEHRHASASYDFIYWVPEALAAADALGWERFSVLAHSLGASIGLCLAGTAPDRVERLALIDGLGPLVTAPEEAPDRLARSIAAQRRMLGKATTSYPTLDDAARHKHRAMPGLSWESARRLTERGLRQRADGAFVWRHDPRLRGHSMLRLTEEHVRAFMRRVTCPVLVVRPRGGWPVEQAQVQARLDCLQSVELIEVDGSHHVHLDDPAALQEQVGAFLAG